MDGVWCVNCRFFTKDTVGDGSGIGNCQVYEDFKAQGATEAQLVMAYRCLGNSLFYGGTGGSERYCKKYEAI